MTGYRIRDWSKHFENNRTRELKELRFVILPNKHDGDGYTELLDHPNGAAHYGAWVAIVQVASKCDVRGTLLRDGDRPHDPTSLSRLTRLPEKVFKEAIPRLVEIGWIEPLPQQNHVDRDIPQEGAALGAAPDRTPLPKSAPEQNGIEEKRIEEKESIAAQARRVFAFWQEHLNHPNAVLDSKREAVIAARLRAGYTTADLSDAVRGCALSDFHMGREPGKPNVHDGVALIFRDAEHVDMFIGKVRSNGNSGARVPTLKEQLDREARL